MSSATGTFPTLSEAPRPSRLAWLRVLAEVVVAPDAAFRRLVARPYWLAAMLLAVAGAFASTQIISAHVDIASQIRERLAEEKRYSAAEIEEAVETGVAVSKIAGVVSAAFTPVSLLATAGLLLLLFTMTGNEVRFRQALSITVHGWIPQTIKTAALTAVLVYRDEQRVEVARAALRSHLGFLAGPDAHPALRTLLESADLFDFWTIALLSAGFALACRLPFRRSAMTIAAGYGVVVAVRVIAKLL